MRLGVYSDLTYRSDGERLYTDRAFIRFVASLPPRVEEVVVFGRLDPKPATGVYQLPEAGIRFVPLPFYPSVTAVGRLARALRRSTNTFLAELPNLDAVWIFGPHPLAVVFAAGARRRGTPLVLGVRQDYPKYIRNRLPGKGWGWALPVAHALELAFRRLARRAPTIALGEELAERYAGGAPVLATGFSLVGAADLTRPEEAEARSWDGELRLLSVGRLDPEKNPLLLAEIIASLREREPRWRLTVAGDGPLRPALEQRVAALGPANAVEFLGEVPNGPALWSLYRGSHAFLHISLTEGLPQVLFEAQAAGLPIVATAVGGVPAALGHGEGGLLVPPADRDAAVEAVERLARDPKLRARLISAGLANAARETMEAQLDRITEFIRAAVADARSRS